MTGVDADVIDVVSHLDFEVPGADERIQALDQLLGRDESGMKLERRGRALGFHFARHGIGAALMVG
jgi:hypothetical protein